MDLRPRTRQKKMGIYIYIHIKKRGGRHPANRDEPLNSGARGNR